jgi:hypothetical protein
MDGYITEEAGPGGCDGPLLRSCTGPDMPDRRPSTVLVFILYHAILRSLSSL